MLGKNKQIDEDIDAAMQRARENAKGSKGDDAQNAEDARGGSNDNAAKLEAEIATLTNDLQRTRADFENYRKQMDAQKENEKKSSRLATIYKILGLLDDLDREFEAYNAELAPLKTSLEKTLK
ncbi:nucleotide exchange factor GrpE, partial [Candidatus Saccharibacteria bacterium]|nr:nucleotide exchange factor GrpE [Candidatus Saccharibacteria bacterium]